VGKKGPKKPFSPTCGKERPGLLDFAKHAWGGGRLELEDRKGGWKSGGADFGNLPRGDRRTHVSTNASLNVGKKKGKQGVRGTGGEESARVAKKGGRWPFTPFSPSPDRNKFRKRFPEKTQTRRKAKENSGIKQ